MGCTTSFLLSATALTKLTVTQSLIYDPGGAQLRMGHIEITAYRPGISILRAVQYEVRNLVCYFSASLLLGQVNWRTLTLYLNVRHAP